MKEEERARLEELQQQYLFLTEEYVRSAISWIKNRQKFFLVMYGRECYLCPVKNRSDWKAWWANPANRDLPEYLQKVENLEELEFILEECQH